MPLAIRPTDRRLANSAGFTLVELLVVIAIAGVLMALLLPSLSQAQEKSRRSVCNQNIHQVLMALSLYGNDDLNGFLPPAEGNSGDYHSIVLSDATYTNLVENFLNGVSNSLFCPNLVHATGKMGGHDPAYGFTIGYSYLAAVAFPPTPKGPDEGWTGPVKSTENREVLADANYWNPFPNEAMTVVPHKASGGVVAMANVAGISMARSASTSLPAGTNSAAMGAVGGNIGSLNGSVIWQPIRSMKQWQASTDGAWGNW